MLVPGGPQDSSADLVYILLELLLALLAVLGNVLVCWAVYLNSNLQNVTNYFVVSLAAADIAVGLLAIPFAIAISTGFCAAFYGCLFVACFVLVLTQGSIFSLLAIAIDRFIAIRMPLRYNALVTGPRAKGIIAVCWVLSLAIGLTPMLGWHGPPAGRNASAPGNCSEALVACLFEAVVTMEYMVYYNFFACVLTPLLLMFGIYLKIFMAARRQLQQLQQKAAAAAQGGRSRSILQKEVHAAKSLAIIVGLFALCWLPLHAMNCATLFCRGCARPPPWVMYLAILLSHANSVVNPLIYAYRIREFRATFRRILRHHLCGKKEERFRPASSGSHRASLYGPETESAVLRSGGGGDGALLDFGPGGAPNGLHLDGGPGKGPAGLRGSAHPRNGPGGAANGHLAPSCTNGAVSSTAGPKREPLAPGPGATHAPFLSGSEASHVS